VIVEKVADLSMSQSVVLKKDLKNSAVIYVGFGLGRKSTTRLWWRNSFRVVSNVSRSYPSMHRKWLQK
jgi:hypothetical protein